MRLRFETGLVAVLAALVFAPAIPAMAANDAPDATARPTFYKDVMPILQENCQTCHRDKGANLSGMIAPMSLTTYRETRPWAKAIARVVETKEMPPWHASDAQHGVFSNERTLTDEQIATVVRWADTGAPRGNPNTAPEPIEWPDTQWNIGEPDLVVSFDEPFFVKDDVVDLYEYITVTLSEEQLPKDKWIKAIEFKPGSEVVHHIIGYASLPGEGGSRGSRGMLGGNAPGADEEVFPEGFGIKLEKGSEVTFAMHYHKEPGPGTGVYDNSKIGFIFHDKPVNHPVDITTVAHGDFEIPPFAEKWKVGAARVFEEDTYLLGMLPHMHLRGAAARYTAYYPDGSTEELLHVPEYDFNWQTGYKYPLDNPKVLPKGTRLEMEFWFTNTKERGDYAGIDPSRAVRFGGPTTDEMDLAWINVAPVEPIEVADAEITKGDTQAGD